MNRREEILKFIIKDFVKTAEPVASKTLAKKNKLKCSSATIRTEMNKLEKEGFLKKIHNSSGRVPLKKAYQYYISHIRNHNEKNIIDKNFKKNLREIIDKKMLSVENVINNSCKILAEMTGLVVFSSNNEANNESLKKIVISPISNNSVSVTLFTNKGRTEKKTFIFSDEVNIADITDFIKIFNKYFSGTLIKEIIPKMKSIKSMLLLHGKRIIYKAVLEIFLDFMEKHYEFYGKDKVFYYPEFQDVRRLRKVLELFDNPTQLELEINKSADNTINDVDIYISDKEKEGFFSVLSVPIYFGEEINSKIFLLGPPRMDYDKAINLLNYLKKEINNYLNVLGGEKNKCQKKSKTISSKMKTNKQIATARQKTKLKKPTTNINQK